MMFDDSGAHPPGIPRGKVERMEKIKIEQHSLGGLLWFTGWLFTLGYLELTFWRGLLALVLWPFYLGGEVNTLLGP